MDVEILHTTSGDRKKKINVDTAKGREEAADLIKRLLRRGTVIFLERGHTYRVTGYDSKHDRLIVKLPKNGETKTVTAKGKKSKLTAVPPIAGG